MEQISEVIWFGPTEEKPRLGFFIAFPPSRLFHLLSSVCSTTNTGAGNTGLRFGGRIQPQGLPWSRRGEPDPGIQLSSVNPVIKLCGQMYNAPPHFTLLSCCLPLFTGFILSTLRGFKFQVRPHLGKVF